MDQEKELSQLQSDIEADLQTAPSSDFDQVVSSDDPDPSGSVDDQPSAPESQDAPEAVREKWGDELNSLAQYAVNQGAAFEDVLRAIESDRDAFVTEMKKHQSESLSEESHPEVKGAKEDAPVETDTKADGDIASALQAFSDFDPDMGKAMARYNSLLLNALAQEIRSIRSEAGSIRDHLETQELSRMRESSLDLYPSLKDATTFGKVKDTYKKLLPSLGREKAFRAAVASETDPNPLAEVLNRIGSQSAYRRKSRPKADGSSGSLEPKMTREEQDKAFLIKEITAASGA